MTSVAHSGDPDGSPSDQVAGREWIHAAAWAPWLELFASQRYDPSAPGWPGDADTVAATRANPDALDGVGIEQICHYYADDIDTFPAKPVVVGHSFGGLIAQELLANDLAIAAPSPSSRRRSRASRRCRSRSCAPGSRCWATRRTRIAPSR